MSCRASRACAALMHGPLLALAVAVLGAGCGKKHTDESPEPQTAPSSEPSGPSPACNKDSDCDFIASDGCCPGFPPAPPYTPVAKGKGQIRDRCRVRADGTTIDINCSVAPRCQNLPQARCLAGHCAVALVESAGCAGAAATAH